MLDFSVEQIQSAFFFAGFIGAALNAAASIGGAILGHKGAKDTNKAAAQRSQEERDWEERMSNTAYQRSMRDMRQAGLNPILAYQKGGASTPNTSAAPVINEMEPAINTARQAAMFKAELDNVHADTLSKETTAQLQRELQKKAKADTTVSSATAVHQMEAAELARSQRRTVEMDTIVRGLDAFLRQEQVHSARSEAKLKELDAQRAEHYGDSVLGRNLQSVERMLRRLYDFLR